jgi:membrane-associated phospholipid phosphatase
MLETIDAFFLDEPLFIPKFISLVLSTLGNIKLHLVGLSALFSWDYLRKKPMDEKRSWLLINLFCVFCIFYLLKISVLRARPFETFPLDFQLSFWQRCTLDALHSFPSSHAAVSAVYLLHLRKSIIIKFLAFFVSSERILNHRHHFSDVLAGFLLALLIVWLLEWKKEEIWTKIKKGKFYQLTLMKKYLNR